MLFKVCGMECILSTMANNSNYRISYYILIFSVVYLQVPLELFNIYIDLIIFGDRISLADLNCGTSSPQ